MGRRGWRARKVRKTIQDLMPKPNVVCLQEVWTKCAAKTLRKTRGYSQSFWFRRAGLLILADREDTRILREKKFVASVDWPFTNKGYQLIRYRDSLIVNTHMQAGFSGILRKIIGVEDYTAVKEHQLREIQEDYLMNKEDSEVRAKYLCGDFNLDSLDDEQGSLVEQYANMMGLYDPLDDDVLGLEKRVDYILVDVDLEDYTTADMLEEQLRYSDHPAVMVFIAVRRSRNPEKLLQSSDQ